ncbi:MAG TPA: TRAM domain-containing protein [Vicinamibacterales bacterium]|nr:TRAM domain-containing protein [Vicinamibacterales bacterium]
MSLAEGQVVELTIEKPASGGRMIARHYGQVVLVRGAIPGERVRALVERAEKRLAYAVTKEVIEASPDRRPAAADPLCGGALYSHVSYPRQLGIKSDVIRDAFARIGRYPIEHAIDVAPSPEQAYRMRARFHVHGARVGFYREGTHQLCDAAATQQLRPEAIQAVTSVAEEAAADLAVTSIAIAENIAGDQRAAHLELAPDRRTGVRPASDVLRQLVDDADLRGLSARDSATGELLTVGEQIVHEPLGALTDGRVSDGVLQRHAESFFQGNRFLLPQLVNAVADLVPDAGEVIDLYAGVGLFSVVLAAIGRLEVTAVEGDHTSGVDLRENARTHEPRLKAHVQSVEGFLAERSGTAATIVVDPPRTGMSADALGALVKLSPERIVYVSCDPPTLARDARRLMDAGYGLASLRAFDFFPNTPHVESLALFARPGRVDERTE